MFTALSPGALGIGVSSLEEAIELARKSGYDGLEINIHEIANLIDCKGTDHVRSLFADAGIIPAAWGLPTDWRGECATFEASILELPRLAEAARSIGCTRTMTWILPMSDDRDYDDNRQFHIDRFKPMADILGQYGCRVGLEFVGPKTLRDSGKYPFIYRMEDMLAMGAEIGPNVGLLLDCWHWYTSGGTIDDLLKLKQEQVVYVHVSDAPRGVPVDEQIDFRRCLPGATGVIDLEGFLGALKTIGYDGPVTPEPFGNPAVWAHDGISGAWAKAVG